jgi:2-succinyl-5-enolpyruvyl-6-hydroxy-3-cyclohexene-1-carboxylate synthase
VVLDNHGGGIFSFLPQADDDDRARFETLFGTPQSAGVSKVAGGFGLPVTEVCSARELRDALAGATSAGWCRVVRVPMPDRITNVGVHQRINDAVGRAAVAALAGGPPAER